MFVSEDSHQFDDASGFAEPDDFEWIDSNSEKRDAFILQHHGYLRLAEKYEAPFPEVLPFSWEQFSIWWDRTPRAVRERLLQILANY